MATFHNKVNSPDKPEPKMSDLSGELELSSLRSQLEWWNGGIVGWRPSGKFYTSSASSTKLCRLSCKGENFFAPTFR